MDLNEHIRLEAKARAEVALLLKEYGLQIVLKCICDEVRPTLSQDHPESMLRLGEAYRHYRDRLLRDTNR